MSFGNKLKILRVSNRLDQDAMSKKLSISQPVYSRYENDEKDVNEHNPVVQRVAAEFNVTAQWLLSEENSNLLSEPDEEYTLPEKKYYNVPKDFMDALLKQQQMTEQVLKMLCEGKGIG